MLLYLFFHLLCVCQLYEKMMLFLLGLAALKYRGDKGTNNGQYTNLNVRGEVVGGHQSED